MKKTIYLLTLCSVLMACTEKKKNSITNTPSETKEQIDKVEDDLENMSKEIKTKSTELDNALNALDNI